MTAFDVVGGIDSDGVGRDVKPGSGDSTSSEDISGTRCQVTSGQVDRLQQVRHQVDERVTSSKLQTECRRSKLSPALALSNRCCRLPMPATRFVASLLLSILSFTLHMQCRGAASSLWYAVLSQRGKFDYGNLGSVIKSAQQCTWTTQGISSSDWLS